MATQAPRLEPPTHEQRKTATEASLWNDHYINYLWGGVLLAQIPTIKSDAAPNSICMFQSISFAKIFPNHLRIQVRTDLLAEVFSNQR